MKKILLIALLLLFQINLFGTTHRAKYILRSNPLDGSINIRAKRQLVRNLDDFTSLLKTAEGYLGHCQRNLTNVRFQLVRGTSGVMTGPERQKLVMTLYAKLDECFRMLGHAQFNCRHLYSGRTLSSTWWTTLAENKPATAFTLSAADFSAALKRIYLRPAVRSCADNIVLVDRALDVLNMERARVGAYLARIEAAFAWHKLYVEAYVKADKNEPIPDLKSAQRFHLRKLEDRLFELSIQAANGVYQQTDRDQIRKEYEQTVLELKRLEQETGIRTVATGYPGDAHENREASEREMLRIARLLLG